MTVAGEAGEGLVNFGGLTRRFFVDLHTCVASNVMRALPQEERFEYVSEARMESYGEHSASI